MERAAVAAFADSYITRQTTMDRLVARSRRGHHYCHHWDDFRWEDTKRRFLDGQSIMRTTATVNLGPYGRYGTVEFRQHQGTLSGRKAVAWVKMLAGLRQRATDGTTDGLGDGLGFLADLLDNRTAAYLIGRADTLAGAR